MHVPPTAFAKTIRPRLAGVLARDRLHALMDARRDTSLLWVAGPPGAGKTTLVAGYLESRGMESRWYQLDSGDSDAATFFYYMSLAGNGPGNGQGGGARPVLPLYTTEYHGDLAAFARRYFETLYASLSTPFVIVLDNYQDVPAQSAFHSVLVDAVRDMPPGGCVVAISRSGPPPVLARLQANREMRFLDWDDMRLTRADSDAIAALWRADLSEETLGQLYEKSQGWAAGLILLLDQIVAQGSIGAVPAVAAPPLLFDYLAGEVFQNFDKPTRVLLLKTAYLSQMTPAMAADLAGEPDADAILTSLHRNYHLVTQRLRPAGPVYQYHPLLTEFLRARAGEWLPATECRRLRRRSSALLEAQNEFDAAAALLVENQDWGAFARLIEERAADMLRLGRAETLEGWLDDLPQSRYEDRPWFAYWRAACRFQSAPRESRLLYEQAFELFEAESPPDAKGLFLACCSAIDAIIYELDDLGLLDRWIEKVTALLDAYQDMQWPGVRARVAASMLMALVFRRPDHPDIRYWREQALTQLDAIDDSNARLTVQLLFAINLNYTGQFAKVLEFVDHMRRMCESPHVSPLALTVLKDVESMYYMLTADRDRCLEAVKEGVEIGRSSGVHMWSCHILSNGVSGALAAGDLDTAEDLLAQIRDYDPPARRLVRCIYHYNVSWLESLRDDAIRAYQEQKLALGLAIESGCRFYIIISHLALAQTLDECGDVRRAFAHLSKVRSMARHVENRLLEFMSLLVFAHIALRHGRKRAGLNALRYALGVGREYGFNHFLSWRPGHLASLCARALEEGIEVDYVRQLIRERGLMPQPLPVSVPRWPWAFRMHTFGAFAVERDDAPLGLTSRRQQKPIDLLKLLLAYGGEGVPETELAAELWPRIDRDYAVRSLTTALHRLRRLLGDERAVVLRHGRLSFDRTRCWLDLDLFDRALDGIDAGLRTIDADTVTDGVEALAQPLLSVYVAPFMAGENGHQCLVDRREELRTRFLRGLGDLARVLEHHDEWAAAFELYERGLSADPLAEGLYRRLMLGYRETGRPADAVEVYQRCAATLRASADAEPAPETTAVYQSLVEALGGGARAS